MALGAAAKLFRKSLWLRAAVVFEAGRRLRRPTTPAPHRLLTHAQNPRQTQHCQALGGCRPLPLPRWVQSKRSVAATASGSDRSGSNGIYVEVAINVEGDLNAALKGCGFPRVEAFVEALEADARLATEQALLMEQKPLREEGAELSVLFCDDATMTGMNKEWRGKNGPTDVLSFPSFEEQPPGYPLRVLGDIVISLDTAKLQADERSYTLRDEARVLLVHGIFHLLGYDHELGHSEMLEMANLEVECFSRLGWAGEGLITLCGDGAEGLHGGASSEESEDSSELFMQPRPNGIKLVAIDMDGTLLNSSSKVTARTAEALRVVLARGVQVVLATGKARPAAISALEEVGLAGRGLVVSEDQPGVFLQGLAVYGSKGELLESASLPSPVVVMCFEHAVENGISLCAFLGDECITPQMTPELEELHYKYYEPLAKVVDSLDEVFSGPPVKKILFMADPEFVKSELTPFLEAELEDSGAQTCQAVPNMIEVVPEGINKWIGMEKLLKHMGLEAQNVMAIGDGMNDLELVKNSGFGVAMANAVPQVLESADAISSSNDEDGVADAIFKYLV